jgi:primosomal protein N' (replication factor Y)
MKNSIIPAVIYRRVDKPEYECKDILNILDNKDPFFSEQYLQLITKISVDYCCAKGEVFDALFNNKLLKSDFSKYNKNLKTMPYKSKLENVEYFNNKFKNNSDLYSKMINGGLITLFESNNIDERIEHYFYLIDYYLSAGKQIKMICSDQYVCEYVINKLNDVFSINIEGFYSYKNLSFKKRYISLYRAGKLMILIGTRGILGIPGKNEGLIILENEEDEFYKQEESPYLQFRNVAITYAKTLYVPIILGTSMPSVESLYYAKKGEYNYINIDLLKAYNCKINIIDMKSSDAISKVLSTEIYDVLYNSIKNNHKSIIIANKKGFSNHLICLRCGAKLMCNRCYIQATYYKTKNYCKCNYCGSSIDLICKNCGGDDFIELGFGLEHIEEILKKLFNKRIIRIDREELLDDNKELELYGDVINGNYDILLGTFVLLRRFQNLFADTGVILGIEDLLGLPDFRIYEKTMKLLFKFVGFIDNFSKIKNFYIQAYDKEMIIFKFLQEGKEAFYDFELDRRKNYRYPPFARLARVVVLSNKREKLLEKTQYIADGLKHIKGIEVIGPSAAPVFVFRNNYRYNFLVKSFDEKALYNSCLLIKQGFLKVKKGRMRCKIDIDPHFFI